MYRTILNEIQSLIERGNGATEAELKQLWNELSDAITQTEQLNLPPVIKSLPEYNEILYHAKLLSDEQFREYWNEIQGNVL